MKKKFINILETVVSILESQPNSDILYFRGHSNSDWKLLPSLFRVQNIDKRLSYVETSLYYDFISNGGNLLGKTDKTSWEIIFLMQHYGLPTRLLDWTESFATALYFALENVTDKEPEIWILNPFLLNSKSNEIGKSIINPEIDLKYNYYEYLLLNDKSKYKRIDLPIAIYPMRENPRLFNQKGLFTLHGKKDNPIEDIAMDCLHRIKIPLDCIEDAKKFLLLSGTNSYSIFNDLDSLSKFLKQRFEI